MSKPSITVSVRELVEFVLRRGDLGTDRDFFSPTRALEGTRGHQRLQRSRPPGYQSEVPVSEEIEVADFVLKITGRVDGILHTPESLLIEEIKTVRAGWSCEPDPLHWAQAKVYAFIYLAHSIGAPHTKPPALSVRLTTDPSPQPSPLRGERQWRVPRRIDHEPRDNFPVIDVQLTYLELDSDAVTPFRQSFAAAELAAFFRDLTEGYLAWVAEQVAWWRLRAASIQSLQFPFPEFRAGQKALLKAATSVLQDGGHLFVEAPTGIGKTISILFPAVKAIAEGRVAKVFYLTAKTVGKTVAEKAIADMCRAGLRVRALTLTAREKICFNNGQPCDVRTCPFAIGYYDRAKNAMRAALEQECLARPAVEQIARQHQVCPAALCADVAPWTDVIICDYNYVFDPKVYLRSFFEPVAGEYAFLVDEAHNLADRAREMFSADLVEREFDELRRAMKGRLPRVARIASLFTERLAALAQEGPMSGDPRRELAFARRGSPTELVPLLRNFLGETEVWLAQNQPAEFRDALLALYFRAADFSRTLEIFDERFVTICSSQSENVGQASSLPDEGASSPRGPGGRKPPELAGWKPALHYQTGRSSSAIKLYCLDPASLLQEAAERGRSVIFFSATLSPLDYFHDLFGRTEEDVTLKLPSPFARENLCVLVADHIATDFKRRSATIDHVADSIAAVVQGKTGNYLVYFPSYQYLTQVLQRFRQLHAGLAIQAQRSGMREDEREAFLQAFRCDHEQSLIGFAVMGGIFGEGIDLVGDRLVGAVIVGVGLPQLSLERDLIREYFEAKNGAGFDYAYAYPGMTRVFQAVGRVIRSENDRGVVLLVDTRFAQDRYRSLFPPWWDARTVRSCGEISAEVQRFWGQ
ncbi:MAG: ATP-dependent DNA helicase [Verrucomicrobia bacterium]|nr:ATP-dependent DNA helicase [Verrucomicrobiota bacterium]